MSVTQESVLYHCPAQADLARRIVQLEPSITLGTTRGTYKGREHLQRFPDDTPDIVINRWRDDRRVNVAYLASFYHPEVYFEQLATMITLREMTTERLTVILPFFPTATMDRSDYEGRVITSQVMAKMLSLIPQAGSGVNELVIYDPHIKQLRGYFHGQMRIEFKHPFQKYFVPAIHEKFGDDFIVVHPDEGSVKRLGHFVNEVVCAKQRVNGGDPIIVIKEGDPRGRHCVIPDDLVQSGGTLIETMKAMKEAGALSVSVVFTHAVCPGESCRRLYEAGFKYVWFSDSNPFKHKELLGLGYHVTEVPVPDLPTLGEPRTEMCGVSLARSMANVIVDRDGR